MWDHSFGKPSGVGNRACLKGVRMASVAAAQQGALRATENEKEAPQGHKGVGGVGIGAWH